MPTGPLTRHLLTAVAAGLLLGACSARLYEGEPRRREDLAVIHVGNTIVRRIDGQARRGGALDVSYFEVAPGSHRIRLVFELPSQPLGLKVLPARPGIGVCDLTFDAQAGRQYYLGARAVGEVNDPRWPGTWEGWVRDPSVSDDDDIIARCQAAEPPAEQPTPASATLPGAAPAAPAPAAPPPVVAPAPLATRPPLAPPAGAALRLGAWHLPGLGAASTADLAGLAPAIDAGFDVLRIAPAFDANRLLALLGGDWASSGSDRETLLYRRTLVRPCRRPAPLPLCLEAISTPPGGSAPLILDLPAAASPP